MKNDEFDDILGEVARRSYNPPPPVPRDAIWAALEAARTRRGGADEIAAGAPASGAGADPGPAPISVLERRRPSGPPVRWWGLGIAATLALGIGIGRVVERQVAPGAVPIVAPVPGAMAGPGAASVPNVLAAPGVASEPGTTPVTGVTPMVGVTPMAGAAPMAGTSVGVGAPAVVIETHPAVEGSRSGATPRVTPASPRSAGEAMSSTYRLAALEHLVKSEVLLTTFQVDARAGRVDSGLELWARELLSTTRLLLDSPAAAEPRLEGLLHDLELVLAQIAQYPESRTAGELELIDQALLDNDVITRLRLAVPSGPLLVRS
jgi:hypothetical protein